MRNRLKRSKIVTSFLFLPPLVDRSHVGVFCWKPIVHFTNILRAAFLPVSSWQKIQTQTVSKKKKWKAAYNTSVHKSSSLNVDEIDDRHLSTKLTTSTQTMPTQRTQWPPTRDIFRRDILRSDSLRSDVLNLSKKKTIIILRQQFSKSDYSKMSRNVKITYGCC